MEFKVGYASANINPPLGYAMAGYYIPRHAKGFLDDLETSALVLSAGDAKIALVSVDVCLIAKPAMKKLFEGIEKSSNYSRKDIFLSATHTHTGPVLVPSAISDTTEEEIDTYINFLASRIADAITMAENDLKPAKMGFIVGQAPERVAYIRRYKMKDGSTMTCPPINDPNIDYPIGELDQRVNVLRFDREGAESVVLVNYGLHADTVNGDLISSDWPGWMRRTVEKALDGTKCMFFPGAEGDVGSTHVFPSGGDMNDTEISFDNEMKSPGMARFVGRALAGTVLQVFDKAKYVDVGKVQIMEKIVPIAANVPDPKDLPLAHKYKELHDSGRDCDIPYEAMELTTVVAEAVRMCELENGPEFFELNLTGVQIGPVALIGIPGEPFTDIGVQIKDTSDWSMIMPCGLVNGTIGYFPMKSAYDEGGYEARASRFKSGVAETIIEQGKELLGELK